MDTELTDEKIKWLNGRFTKEDCKEIGMDWKKEYEGVVRWQMANIAAHALQRDIPYNPSDDPRFTLDNYEAN